MSDNIENKEEQLDKLKSLGYTNLKQKAVDIWAEAKEVFKKLNVNRELPEITPISLKHGTIIYASMGILGSMISSTIGTYVFFGTVTLAGFIALAESSKHLKFAVNKSNRFIDFILFGATLYATATLGVTVSAALTFAGLGYTLMYAPYLREKANKLKTETV